MHSYCEITGQACMDMDMDRQANSLVNKYAFAISKFSP
jgi:hypothetical protein